MRTVSPLAVALLLGFGATALVAAEQPTTGPSGFSSATESANSKGKTGESAECPIKKTVGGKTFCFQNDPALTKPQGRSRTTAREGLASAQATRYNGPRPR
jgi:hypothetical protein